MSATPADANSLQPGWDDELSRIEVRATGANDPAFNTITGTSQRAYQFAVNDRVWLRFHIKHSYRPGSGVYPHVHWLADGADANLVKWEWIYTFAKGHGQQALQAEVTTTVQQAPAGNQVHMITEVADPGILAGLIEPDTLVMARLRRVTNGGTDNVSPIFALFADMHYRVDRFSTPNKAPDFYS